LGFSDDDFFFLASIRSIVSFFDFVAFGFVFFNLKSVLIRNQWQKRITNL